MEEIMRQVESYLKGKYEKCGFYDDERILENLNSIVDKAYDIIYDALHDADAEIDYEIEDFNENYAEAAKRAQIIALKNEREEDTL